MSDSTPDNLRILFFGELLPGTDRNAAEAFIAKRFQLDDAKLRQVMSGRKVALRINLDQQRAFALQAELEAAGLVTRIETMQPPAGTGAPAPDRAPSTARFEVDDPAIRRAPKPVAPADVDGHASARIQTKAAVLKDEVPEAPAPVVAADPLACPACRRPVAARALHCRWCGQRLQSGSRLWLWMLAIPGALVLLVLPLILWWQLPNLAGLGDMINSTSELSTAEQVAQGQAEAQQIQEQIREFVQRTNFWPNSTLDAGLGEPEDLASEVLARVDIGANSLITIHFRPELPEIGGTSLAFVPEKGADGLPRWHCRGGSLPAEWRPPECNEAGAAPTSSSGPAARAPAAPATDPDGSALPPEAFVRRVFRDELANTLWIRLTMMEHFQATGDWPESHDELGLEDPYQLGSYAMRQVRVEPGGRIRYEFSSAVELIQGEVVMLVPGERPGVWYCESGLPDSHLPKACFQGVR